MAMYFHAHARRRVLEKGDGAPPIGDVAARDRDHDPVWIALDRDRMIRRRKLDGFRL
jgi:hypothetical protein